MIVAKTESKVQIRNYSNGKLIHTIENCERAASIALNGDFTLISDYDFKISVFGIRDGYNLLKTIVFGDPRGNRGLPGDCDMTFLNVDIVMVLTSRGRIFFVSLESGQCFFYFGIESPVTPRHVTVLSDGRICVSGWSGYCTIIRPPQEVEVYFGEYTKRRYSHPLLPLLQDFTPALKSAFNGVQGKYCSIYNALKTGSRFEIKFHIYLRMGLFSPDCDARSASSCDTSRPKIQKQ